MQTVARVATPRLITISRRNSTASAGSVHIEQEVTVTSRSKSDAEVNDLHPVYKTTSLVSMGVRPTTATSTGGGKRSKSRDLARDATLEPRPEVNRWKSMETEKLSPIPSGNEPKEMKLELLDSNMESMRALAEFFRFKEPPPDHFMSIPDVDTEMGRRKGKAYQLFGRRRKKKQRTQNLIQLPDSAISSKTRRGSRHIAISIPIEYDFPEEPPTHELPKPQTSYTAGKANHPEPVVVLKPTMHRPTKLSPLAEVQEVTSPRGGKRDSRNARSDYMMALGSTPIGWSSPHQKGYVAVSPDDTIRRDSQFGDKRHSGGTQYSTASLNYEMEYARGICNAIMGNTQRGGHSREISGVSSAPSSRAIKVELPPRGQSFLSVSSSDAMREAWDDHVRKLALDMAEANRKSLARDERDEQVFEREGVQEDLEEPTRGRSRYRRQSYVRVVPSRAASALPSEPNMDTPAGTVVHDFQDDVPIPEPSLSITPPEDNVQQRELLQSHPKDKGSSMIIANSDDTYAAARESRQERVRARKARDMAALRERSQASSAKNISPPTHTLRHKSASVNRSRRRRSVLSQVMVVADLAPTGAHRRTTSSPPSSPALRAKHNNNATSIPGTPTPPRSAHGSDSDTLPQQKLRHQISPLTATTAVNTLSPRSATASSLSLASRRQERRARRNESAREKGRAKEETLDRETELEIRIGKLESENRMLARAIGGIGQSFRELGMLLPGLKGVGGVGDDSNSPVGLAGGSGAVASRNTSGANRNHSARVNGGRSVGRRVERASQSDSEYWSGLGHVEDEEDGLEEEYNNDGGVRDIEPVMRELQASMADLGGMRRF